MSLGKVEAALKTCAIIENMCVYGDPTKQNTVALIVPNFQKLTALANNNEIYETDIEKLCSNKAVEQLVLTELIAYGKKCKFIFTFVRGQHLFYDIVNFQLKLKLNFLKANYKNLKYQRRLSYVRMCGRRTWV